MDSKEIRCEEVNWIHFTTTRSSGALPCTRNKPSGYSITQSSPSAGNISFVFAELCSKGIMPLFISNVEVTSHLWRVATTWPHFNPASVCFFQSSITPLVTM
jgi:hypothetical protein